METDLVSLFLITLMAFVCPIATALIPKKLIPETVFFLIAGMIIGPNVLGIAHEDSAISLFSDMGLGFLFLLAGYEINPKDLSGKQGRIGFLTWLVSFGIAIGVTAAFPNIRENSLMWMAASIVLTTTAFGTLVPILKDNGLTGTRIGSSIVSYGAWGEIAPVIATAIVLSTRKTWVSLVILLAFALIAVFAAIIPKSIWNKNARAMAFFERNADTNAQMTIRAVVMLMTALLAVSAVFDLDIVLGAFAAGFILRYIIPQGDAGLEHKLHGIGFGFFIPLFFIVSGMQINPRAMVEDPLLLFVFILMLFFVRALPIYISMKINPETKDMSVLSRATVAIYCTTALPLIVAVTSIATGAGAMSADTASILVGAGGITVLLMPILASLLVSGIKKYEHDDGLSQD